MKKIILVEQNEELLDFYRAAFAKTDFDVEVASDVGQMLEELRCIRVGDSQKPDLVLIDFMMPDTKGVEILRAIKKSYHTNDIPVFAFTNYHNPHFSRQLEDQKIKPERYLIKANYTPSELVGAVNNYFETRQDIHTTLS